jgi:hypothetical protein
MHDSFILASVCQLVNLLIQYAKEFLWRVRIFGAYMSQVADALKEGCWTNTLELSFLFYTLMHTIA